MSAFVEDGKLPACYRPNRDQMPPITTFWMRWRTIGINCRLASSLLLLRAMSMKLRFRYHLGWQLVGFVDPVYASIYCNVLARSAPIVDVLLHHETRSRRNER
uniref:Uncharacterized protein n=1 Tax=Rhizobium rhizogenes TaxID=359 RepID=A0A7S4ZT42_RHIRH|nr:hypothetical protein pC5.7b_407 [Rhizobium rhizogenes]